MDIKILEEKENPLIGRKEIKLKVFDYSATPSRKELEEEIKKKFNTNFFIIKRILQSFGKRECKVFVSIYKDESTLKKFESKKLKKEQEKQEKTEEKKGKEGERKEEKEGGKKEEKAKEEGKKEEEGKEGGEEEKEK